MDSFSYLEPVCCSMSSSNCCFLTYFSISQELQISQEAGQVVWYSHLLNGRFSISQNINSKIPKNYANSVKF